jgi:hypothetical protein
MAIVVPDQGSIDLGVGRGSSIRPADTYAKPAVQDAGGGLAELSQALSNLGGQFSELAGQQDQGNEALDRRRADYYANVLRPEIKDGIPVEVQLGKLRPEMSASVRALVAEGMLQQRGKEWAQSEYEKLQTDPSIRLSPEKMQAWRENMLNQAREHAGQEVTGGAAYFRAVQRYIDEAENNAMNERTGLYNKVQEQKLVEDTINSANDAHAAATEIEKTYTPTAGDPASGLTNKIIKNPNLEGYGKNPNSSAQGVGQFINGTWISEVQRQDPESARGRTKEQILALRNDPRYAARILEGFTKRNAETLKSRGIDANETNLYIMHFAGEGDAPKIIKSSDGTKLSDVMDPDSLKANKFLTGMTVGQFKEWAAKKVGGPVGPIAAAQNSVRSVDQLYAQVGGLDNVRRREIIAAGLMKNATDSLDTKYLQYMPPELMTPSLQLQFSQVERQVNASVRQQRMQALQDQKIARDAETEQGKDQITQAVAAGKTINPADYGGNSELFEYANRFNKYHDAQIDEAKSANSRLDYNDRLANAVASKQWSKLSPEWQDGVAPTMSQIRQNILSNPDMKASDKVALMGEVGKTLDTANFVASDEMTQYFDKQMGDTIKGLYQNPMGAFARKFDGIDVYGQVRDTYLNALRMGAQAAAEDGKDLKGETKLRIVEAAEAKARQKLKDISDSIGASGSGGEDKAKKPEAKSTPKESTATNESNAGNAVGVGETELKKFIINGKPTYKRVPKGSTTITGDTAKDAEIAKDRASRMVSPGRSGAPPKQ